MDEYKYLGVKIHCTGRLTDDLKLRREKQIALDKKQWLLKIGTLNGATKLQLWHALYKSKWTYASEILSTRSKDFKDWIES